jgi:hypothetical protein
MSLYLPDQKLGSHSQPGSSSHKFVLKGRQTGGLHRGHSWIFRAESYETMLAWYDNIKSLTEYTGEDRNNFVRRHTRSISRTSTGSVSSLEEDEADRIPYSATVLTNGGTAAQDSQRPQPGGRFPSDVQVRTTDLPERVSPSSDEADVHQTIGSSFDSKSDATVPAHVDRTHEPAREVTAGVPQEGPNSYGARNPWAGEAAVAPRRGFEVEDTYLMTPAIATVSLDDGSTLVETVMVPTRTEVAETANKGVKMTLDASRPISQDERHLGYAVKAGQPLPVDEPHIAPMKPVEADLVSKPVTEGSTKPLSSGISRVNTDVSISNLHIPGKYPKGVSM